MFGHSHSAKALETSTALQVPEFSVCHRTTFAITASHEQRSIEQMQKCIWHGMVCAVQLHTNDIRQTSAASCEMFSSFRNTFSAPRSVADFSVLHSFSFLFFCSISPLLCSALPIPGVLFTLFFTIKHIFPVLCKIYSRDKHLRKVYLSLVPPRHHRPNELYTYIFFSFFANQLECKLFALAFLLFISFLRAKCQTTLSHTQIV